MKSRSPIRIAGLMIALIFLFAALPLQAQFTGHTSINDLEFRALTLISKWQLSWTTLDLQGPDPDIQFKGGGITDVWTTVNNLSVNVGTPKTYVRFSPLTNSPAGSTFHFRARAEACTPTACSIGDWDTVSHTFD